MQALPLTCGVIVRLASTVLTRLFVAGLRGVLVGYALPSHQGIPPVRCNTVVYLYKQTVGSLFQGILPRKELTDNLQLLTTNIRSPLHRLP